MGDIRYDLSKHGSKSLYEYADIEFDYAITMGCGDACPNITAKNRDDWQIPDPKHMPIEEFKQIRDCIEDKVKKLIETL